MGVEKTRYGTYRARWTDPNGKRHARSFNTAADARAHYRKMLGDIARDEYVDPRRGKIKLREWSERWLEGARNLGQGGLDTYRRDLERYILPELGDHRIDRIDSTLVDRFLTGLLERDLAASTVHRQYRILHRCFKVAITHGYLAKNPCGPVQPPRDDAGEMHFLTAEQLEVLHDAFAQPAARHGRRRAERYAAWVWVAGYGGLRWSETRGLRPADIDGNRVTVVQQLVKRADGEWHRDDVKTKAGRRVVTLPAFAGDELAEHIERWSTSELVFPTGKGTPPGLSFGANVFKPALLRAGLPNAVRIHDLRHTAAALAIATGAHPKALQVRMGHRSITTTLDRYGHLYPEMDETIAAKLDDIRADVLRKRLRAV